MKQFTVAREMWLLKTSDSTSWGKGMSMGKKLGP